ncbi:MULTISPECIES: AAA family ATPase [unclassified Paenibacillus]|uniref:AAA family ATPase n=1 Tax=unclassified Paenibacillus TaxID=185978 RepID=UPI000953C0A8|nr:MULTISPECIES: AAA family ATPase [unclassified Paenibacillus]ASS67179.1 AAA domain-containing protein [Paenibacillus sp. RUD330]SIQ87013.1 MoxR-like ATPase [Paenibacillus sp. RU4X]SIR08290.1 MoxR-like ATPase [Paenibacillus sp. RU4T]
MSHNIPNKLREAAAHLENRFQEREELIRVLLLALMSGEHLMLVGPPGSAKSQLARSAAALFGSSRSFDYLLTRFTTPDELFGPVSLQQLKQDRYVRQTQGYLPEARFAFLDEIFKASSAILNSLLSILNERIFYNGAEAKEVPLLSLIAASNELPEEQEGLAALYDRFLFRYETRYLQQIASFERMFQGPDTPPPALLDAGDVRRIQDAAAGAALPEPVLVMLFRLKTLMEEKEYILSDRRWRRIGRTWQVSAAIHGRDAVSVWDTVLTPHLLWDFPEDLEELRGIFAGVWQELLAKEMDKELPLASYRDTLQKWLSREEELSGFQFRKEVGSSLGRTQAERLVSMTDEARSELEETARSLQGRLVAWQEKEKQLPAWIESQSVFILHADEYAVRFTHLRIGGEKVLQQLQGLYRTLFDKDIPGVSYDYTL